MVSKANQKRYSAKWYQLNKEQVKVDVKARTKAQRDVLRAIVLEKKSVPCVDCKGRFPAICMDFDHLRDKDRDICRLVNAACSVARLNKEIAKCEVVCACCHRLRTQTRRLSGQEAKEAEASDCNPDISECESRLDLPS